MKTFWAIAFTILLTLTMLAFADSDKLPTTQPNPSASDATSTGTTFRIAFGSCARQTLKQPIWERVLAAKPDVFVFLGDNVYASGMTPAEIRKQFTIFDAKPGFKKLRETIPLLATWDDHDYGLNDGGREHRHRDAAQTVFLDWLGIPADDTRRKQKGVYSATIVSPPNAPGKRIQIILLDTRYHRSPLAKVTVFGNKAYVPKPGGEQVMLGETQWEWLEKQLQQPADLRILGSSIQLVAQDHPGEKWANFPKELERFHKLLEKHKTENLVVISGDIHLGELSKFPRKDAYPLYDLTSSGLTHARKQAPNQRFRVGDIVPKNHFGIIEIHWPANPEKPTKLALQIRTIDNKTPINHTIPLTDLTYPEKPATKN